MPLNYVCIYARKLDKHWTVCEEWKASWPSIQINIIQPYAAILIYLLNELLWNHLVVRYQNSFKVRELLSHLILVGGPIPQDIHSWEVFLNVFFILRDNQLGANEILS